MMITRPSCANEKWELESKATLRVTSRQDNRARLQILTRQPQGRVVQDVQKQGESLETFYGRWRCGRRYGSYASLRGTIGAFQTYIGIYTTYQPKWIL